MPELTTSVAEVPVRVEQIAAVVAALVPGPVETHEVADVSHILRVQERRPSLSRYEKDIKGPVDARVLDLVVSWLGRHC